VEVVVVVLVVVVLVVGEKWLISKN
jgi:hypothetical protein